ncbi:MAG: hypothetical protein MUE51_15370, partial [Thermoleophilia bacterium]|nr:hypothetical protein [Thermoleophilia bacterium]
LAGAGGVGGAGAGGNGGLATGATATGGGGGTGFGDVGGPGGDGGGVAVTGGALQVTGSTIEANRAGAGGALGPGVGGLGGTAIGASGTGGQGGQGNFDLPDTQPGAGGGEGGGVSALVTVDATISRSLIVGNAGGAGGRGTDAEGGRGGGVTEPGRPAGTGGGAVAGNGGRGGDSGGIALRGLVEDSTITGNTTGPGGAGGNATGGRGGNTDGGASSGGFAWAGDAGSGGWVGGAWLDGPGPTSSLRHGTVAGNTLGSSGAVGTAVGGPPGTGAGSGATGSTLSGTPAPPPAFGGVLATAGAVIANTIVSGNADVQCQGVTDGGRNISFPDTTCPGANADPLLGPLADRGGPTRTLPLLTGSPAVGGVPAAGAGCSATDQRGITRPQGIACDIGAYEQAPPVVLIGATAGVSTTGATLLGTVTPNLQATTSRFEFGTTTAYGSQTPLGDVAAAGGATPVSAAIAGLAPGTTYHYRLVATNADGTSTSGDATFTTAAGAGATGGGGTTGGGATEGAGTTGGGTGTTQGTGLPPAKADLSRLRSPIIVDRRGRFTLPFRATPALAGGADLRSRRAVRVGRTRVVTVARAAFTVPATGGVTLRIRLSSRELRILRRSGRILTRVTVTLTDPAGARSQASKRVLLRMRS